MRLLMAFAFILAPVLAQAQASATLVADSVFVPAGGNSLVASGNVEVFFEGTRLSAQRITFDQTTDSLQIEGPIFIVASDGTILTADAGSLDPQLKNGILRGARLVLNDQLQLAATQIDQVEGRYTQLYQVAATSCHVCANGSTPLWEIRAQRVIHDSEEQQLYFDNAVLRVSGVPIFYVPRMRLPDPSLRRATGLLIPSIASTDTLGTGIKLPYFIELGDHRDLTLTPYLSTSTKTLEATYRQAYLNGDLAIEGAISEDDLVSSTRAYLFADGVFDLGDDVILRFDVEYASDDDYLLEYNFSDKDRLDSEFSIERIRDRDFLLASVTYFSSLRDGEDSSTLPPLLGDIDWERRTSPDWGGTLTFTSDVQSHYRETSEDIVGRDVIRFGYGVNYRRNHITNFGLVIEGDLGFQLDTYSVNDDSDVGDTFRATTYTQTSLRYPLIRSSSNVTHVIEPVVQLAWSDVGGNDVVNEDSTTSEFDQANLISLSRFTGEDAVETGFRVAAGLTWTRIGQTGWDSTLTVGRVFREDDNDDFTLTSGLSGTASDWLIAGQLLTPMGLTINSRLLVTEDYDVTKSETRAGWSGEKLDLSASYIFLPEDAGEDRDDDVSEWTIDAAYRFNDTWTMGFDARYDIISNGPSETGLEIGWKNECVNVDFSVSRRFTTSTTLDASTDFGLSVGLNGFSAGHTVDSSAHRCTK